MSKSFILGNFFWDYQPNIERHATCDGIADAILMAATGRGCSNKSANISYSDYLLIPYEETTLYFMITINRYCSWSISYNQGSCQGFVCSVVKRQK